MDNLIEYGSLCTGYDGIGLGLALAGVPIRPLWFAEVEPAMSRVLKREHDDVPNVGDIKIAPWQLAPHVKLMSSGDPCQSISIAGRQAGRDDPRFLWPWVRHAYRNVMPDVLFFENVANIVSHDGGRTLAERHDDLRTDGYEVRWCLLGACAVGAPHHRHRYYAVAVRWAGPGEPPAARRMDSGKAICGAPRSGGRYMLPTPVARDADGRGEGTPEYWAGRSTRRNNGAPLGAVVNLLPTPDASMATRGGMLSPPMALRRMADQGRSTNLDDAVASLLSTPTARDGLSGPGRTAAREGSDDLRTLVTLLPTPMVSDATGGHSEPEIGGVRPDSGAKRMDSLGSVARLLPTPTTSNVSGNRENSRGELLLPGVVSRPEVWGKFAEAVALWEAITGVPAPAPTEPGAKGAPRLSAALPEWMMGLRPGLLTDELSRPEALKGAGNGVVPLACAAAWHVCTQAVG